MNLPILVKDYYSIEEVALRWQQINTEYDIEFVNRMIAQQEIPASIYLQNCFLFPVSKIDELYKYLELYMLPTSSENVHIDTIHNGNIQLIQNRKKNKKTVFVSAWVHLDANMPNIAFNKTSLGKYHHTYEDNNLAQLFIDEADLLCADSLIGQHYIESNCRMESQIESDTKKDNCENQDHIIHVECPIAVTPFVGHDDSLGISFVPPSEFSRLKELNLSSFTSELEIKLSQCSIVKWNKNLYYVVNKNIVSYQKKDNFSLAHKTQETQCLSLSSDVLYSYEASNGAVISKQDVEKFERKLFAKNTVTPPNSDKENTLNTLTSIVSDFQTSIEFRNHGSETEQGFIEDWIKSQPYKVKGHHVRILKELISEHYGITTGRPR